MPYELSSRDRAALESHHSSRRPKLFDDNLPWDVAMEIDTKYDDGVYNTGNIRANEDYTAAGSPVAYFYMPL